MDRNTGIGLVLIAVLLLAYFYWFAPKTDQTPPSGNTPAQTAPLADSSSKQQPAPQQQEQALAPDTSTHAALGPFAPYIKGEGQLIPVETNDLKIVFSSHGGTISDIELKHFKTYYQQPIHLITPDFQQQLKTSIQGEELDLYALNYQITQSRRGDTTVVRFSIPLSSGQTLAQEYTIPPAGYEIGYSLSLPEAGHLLGTNVLSLVWHDALPAMEKNLLDTRYNTTITYYRKGSGYDGLSRRSTSDEDAVITDSLRWIAFKEKFFLTSIIADHSFAGGELRTHVPPKEDTTTVKDAYAKVLIPTDAIATHPARFTLYVGPNDYKILDAVAPGFISNVYIGWPPVKWVNRFFIIPIFHFLSRFIGNYGLIIVILVLAVRLLLLPLSYRSYKSMAKMRVLKPELDELKSQYGDDASKVQQEQLKLYQEVGVNPLSGCFPLLLQMPILFAMYYLFPSSIELRQQHFLWANDLSTYDSIVNLPFSIPFYGSHVSLFTLLMTVSTIVYTWQNNQITSVTGPMKSMSYVMPVVLLFVLNSFPSGLSFYYFVSNLVTFGQQAIIKRFVDEGKIRKLMEDHRRLHASGGTKKSKFMSKLQDAMKASEEARKKSGRR